MNIFCGLKAFDEGSKGMKEGDVTLVAGVPGGNKTNMLLNMAYGFQSKGISVMFLTLESDSQSIQLRCMCRAMGINYDDITAKELTPEIKRKIREYSANSASRIAIGSASYRSSLTKFMNFVSMRAIIRPFNVLMVDPINLLESGHEDAGKDSMFSTIRQLRILGAEHGFATIATTSLSHKAASRFRAQAGKAAAIPDSGIGDPSDFVGTPIALGAADNIYALRPMEDNKIEVSAVKLRYSAGFDPVTMKVIPQQFKVVDCDPAFEFAPVAAGR